MRGKNSETLSKQRNRNDREQKNIVNVIKTILREIEFLDNGVLFTRSISFESEQRRMSEMTEKRCRTDRERKSRRSWTRNWEG